MCQQAGIDSARVAFLSSFHPSNTMWAISFEKCMPKVISNTEENDTASVRPFKDIRSLCEPRQPMASSTCFFHIRRSRRSIFMRTKSAGKMGKDAASRRLLLISFKRHQEIYPKPRGAQPKADAPVARLDEFPAGYSLPGCSSALPVSASPAGVTMLSGQPNSGAFKKCYLCLGTCVTHVLGPKTHEEGIAAPRLPAPLYFRDQLYRLGKETSCQIKYRRAWLLCRPCSNPL